MPINVAAYDYANRSSEVTADVVARLGFIPDRVERKMTVGQQRRGRRKKRLKGRGGSVEAWGIFTSDALRKYARDKGVKPFPTKKPARIQALIARDDADVAELNAMIRDGSIEGGVKNYLSDKAPTAPTSTDVQQAAEQLRQTTAQSPPTGQPAPQPEDETLTYSQPPTNPAEDAPPADVSAAQQADVEETGLVQLSARQILEQSGLNSLDEIDSSEDVELLQESIEDVSARAPEGVAAGLWGVITTAAGLNLMKAVESKSGTPMPARAAAQVEVGDITELQALEIAADHVDTVNQSVSTYKSSQSTTLSDRPDATTPLGISTSSATSLSQSSVPATPSQSNVSSGVDLSTAAYTPGAATPSFAVSPVQQQADMTSAIIDAVNDSQSARDTALLAPLEQTTNLISNTNRLLGSLNTQQLAAINRLGPELQTKLVTDRQLDQNEVPSVLKVLQDDPDIAELLRQGLVQPEQLKDPAYVASLRMNLLKNKSEGRPANLRGRVRASKAPVFKRQVASRRTPGLRYYKRARHVAPSIFAQ
eukprot:COSAG01_NODE_5326_length_4332_cov_15.167730_2_plen_536_part_00